jgi:hypothetical protein
MLAALLVDRQPARLSNRNSGTIPDSMNTREDLLKPSLGQSDSPANSIYSARTGYIASFFGGPLGGAIIALANAYRLKRLKVDWPIGVLALAVTIGPIGWWMRGGAQWAAAYGGRDAAQVGFRVVGLGFFAVVYAWHRRYYRNMTLFGIKPPTGTLIGLVAVVAGLATEAAIVAALS